MEDQQSTNFDRTSFNPNPLGENSGFGCAFMGLVGVTLLTAGIVQFCSSYFGAEKQNQASHKITYTFNHNHVYNSTTGLVKRVSEIKNGN